MRQVGSTEDGTNRWLSARMGTQRSMVVANAIG